MIITNSRYALVGYFITSYPTRAHGIIVIYTRKSLNRLFNEFSREFNFPDFGFFEFRGNRHQGIIFRGFIVQYVKVTKTEAIWPLQLHCLQSISLKFGNVNNGRRLFPNFF